VTVPLAAARAPRTAAWLLVLWCVAVLLWWGFAFLPAPPGDDSWLAAAQAACFGSLPGGLPAVQGWLMLTLAPLLLLATLLAAFHHDLRMSLPELRGSGGWRALALVLACLAAAEAGFAAMRIDRAMRIASISFSPAPTEPLPEGYPRTAEPIPPFTLIDQHGVAFTSSALRGRPTVMSFVFAHCRTVCPALLTTLGTASRALGPDAAIVIVTLDPWRDTPAALATLAGSSPLPADARWLSGDPDRVCRVLDQLQVARERDLRNGDVTHVPLVFVLDDEGRIAYRFNNPPAEWVVESVRRVQQGR
jgi:cytochrome oxidase Cu insertion factor (SCO1/SenC/PrrC family)